MFFVVNNSKMLRHQHYRACGGWWRATPPPLSAAGQRRLARWLASADSLRLSRSRRSPAVSRGLQLQSRTRAWTTVAIHIHAPRRAVVSPASPPWVMAAELSLRNISSISPSPRHRKPLELLSGRTPFHPYPSGKFPNERPYKENKKTISCLSFPKPAAWLVICKPQRGELELRYQQTLNNYREAEESSTA